MKNTVVIAGGTGKIIFPAEATQALMDQGYNVVLMDSSGEMEDIPCTLRLDIGSGQGGGGRQVNLIANSNSATNIAKHGKQLRTMFANSVTIFVGSAAGATGGTAMSLMLDSIYNEHDLPTGVFFSVFSETISDTLQSASNAQAHMSTLSSIRDKYSANIAVIPFYGLTSEFKEMNEAMRTATHSILRIADNQQIDLTDFKTKFQPKTLMNASVVINPDDGKVAMCYGRLSLHPDGAIPIEGTSGGEKDVVWADEDTVVLSLISFDMRMYLKRLNEKLADSKAALRNVLRAEPTSAVELHGKRMDADTMGDTGLSPDLWVVDEGW